MNPSLSAQNPISQPLKKANPSSHFTPSRPSLLFPTLLYLALLYFLTPLRSTHSIGLIRIRGIALEQACNGGPCGGLSLRD